MVVTDHYETLGVPYNASLKDINSAYKRLALKHHPDKAGGGDIDDFQKVISLQEPSYTLLYANMQRGRPQIQQAAETLRDPIRRRRHDHELRVHRVKCQQGPVPAPGSSGTGSGYYSRWMPSSVGSYSMGTSGYRYMYSYGNSVHMNPDSQDSVDERERVTRERKLDEEIRQRKFHHHHGPSSSSNEEFERTAPRRAEKSREGFEDKSWEMRRQEAMKTRVVRDEKELDDEGGQGESQHGKGEHAKEQKGHDHPEVVEEEQTHEEESGEKGGRDPTDYENEQEGEDGDEDEDDSIVSSDAQSTSEYGTAQESEISDSVAEDGGPCTEEEDMTIFYDCKQSHLPNNANTAASQDESASESDTSEEDEEEEEDGEEEEQQQKDNNTNTNETSPSLLSPFIPRLNAKLNDPSGKYTKEDLHVELYGIVMETYCGWLESLRLTFPDAKPTSSSENEPQQGCLHLGYWEKTFGCPECEVCHRWKPIYTLTCRGCAIKACVGCKFQGEHKA